MGCYCYNELFSVEALAGAPFAARMRAMSAATLFGLLDALPLLAILGVAIWQFAKRPDAQPQPRSLFLKKIAIIIAGAFLGLFIPWSLGRLGLYLDPVKPGPPVPASRSSRCC